MHAVTLYDMKMMKGMHIVIIKIFQFITILRKDFMVQIALIIFNSTVQNDLITTL